MLPKPQCLVVGGCCFLFFLIRNTCLFIYFSFIFLGTEGLYRNNYADVKLFMEDYHRGHYKVGSCMHPQAIFVCGCPTLCARRSCVRVYGVCVCVWPCLGHGANWIGLAPGSTWAGEANRLVVPS